MNPLIGLLLMFFLVWISGCAAPSKRPVMDQSKAEVPLDPLISEAMVDERIRFMEQILEKKTLSPKARDAAIAVLNAYQQLKDSHAHHLTEEASQELIRSLFKAMGLMDKICFEESGGKPDSAGNLALFARKRDAIVELYRKGHHREVIEETLRLNRMFGPNALTPEIGLLLALSLAKEGDVEQAVQTGEAVAPEVDRLPDAVQLRSDLARWQLALGKTDMARQTYEKLKEDQEKRTAQVQEVGRQVSAYETRIQTLQPGTARTPQNPIADDVWPEEGYTMDQVLEKIHALMEIHAYSKARILILQARIRLGEGPEDERLDRELETIAQREAEFESRTRDRETDLEQTKKTVRQWIEEEKYEAAIQALREMEGVQPLDPEARALNERAVESLINKQRNRAADLFLEAKKAHDLEKKKALLESADTILKRLVETYPSSPLSPKLKSHIASVENELKELK